MTTKAQFDALAAQINADLDALSPPSGGSQVYNLPSNHAVTISGDGVSLIKKQGATVAYGVTQVQKAEWWLGQSLYSAGYTPTITSKSVSFPSTNVAIVNHTFSGILNGKSVMRHEINGDDITVTAEVYNFDSTVRPITAINITPQLHTGGYSSGYSFPTMRGTNNPIDNPYPNFVFPIGGMYFKANVTPGLNGALWPIQDPSLKWNVAGVGTFPDRLGITMFFYQPIAPGGKETFKFVLRIANEIDYQTLLTGYKTHLRNSLSIGRATDVRPIATFLSIDQSHVTPSNPYGYNDSGNGKRRFDLDTQPFVDWVTPGMLQANCQGMLMWQPQGINPRGVQYRPDFNVFPPETLANLSTLTQGFNGVGLTVGLLARPSAIITSSSTWGQDRALTLSDDSSFVKDLLSKFTWAIGVGFEGFYLDSFATSYSDHNMLKSIRSLIGPQQILLVEQTTALTPAYGYSYIKPSYTGDVFKTDRDFLFEIIRWLWPESVWCGFLPYPIPSSGNPQVYTDLLSRKITPMTEDYLISAGEHPTLLEQMLPQYVNAQNQWI